MLYGSGVIVLTIFVRYALTNTEEHGHILLCEEYYRI